MVEMVISKSKTKEIVENCNVSGDFTEKLNQIAIEEIKKAAQRTQDNSRKTVQGRDVYSGEKKSDVMIVIKSKVKEHVGDLNVSSDFSEGLNQLLVRHINDACMRAEANGRKTVQARDL